MIVEVGAEAARTIDSRLTNRLVALETTDIDVPAPPSSTTKPTLYYRVLVQPGDVLRVELWELGTSSGARRISAEGTGQLKARRIALAAAELARQLRRRRLVEIAAADHPKVDAQKESNGPSGFPIHAAFAFDANARFADVGGDAAVLVGPELASALRFSGRQEVVLGAAWLAGDSSRLEGSSLRWLEAHLSLSQGFLLARTTELQVGAGLGVASVHAATTDDWSARAGLEARLRIELGRHLALKVGPDVGALLHRVEDDGGGRLSGLWLGASAGLQLLP